MTSYLTILPAKLHPLLLLIMAVKEVTKVPSQTVTALTAQVPMVATAKRMVVTTIGPPVTTRNV